MNVTRFTFAPKYTRDNGVYVLDTAAPPLPANFTPKEPSLVHIPAGQVAGNHRHPRQEAFVCFQPGIELHWIDTEGKKHIDTMAAPDGSAALFVVPSQVPHAVVNTSGAAATLMAYADGPLVDVVPMEVV